MNGFSGELSEKSKNLLFKMLIKHVSSLDGCTCDHVRTANGCCTADESQRGKIKQLAQKGKLVGSIRKHLLQVCPFLPTFTTMPAKIAMQRRPRNSTCLCVTKWFVLEGFVCLRRLCNGAICCRFQNVCNCNRRVVRFQIWWTIRASGKLILIDRENPASISYAGVK